MPQDPRNLSSRERRDLSRQASKASKTLFNECISIIEGIFFKKKKKYRQPYDDPEEQKRRKQLSEAKAVSRKVMVTKINDDRFMQKVKNYVTQYKNCSNNVLHKKLDELHEHPDKINGEYLTDEYAILIAIGFIIQRREER